MIPQGTLCCPRPRPPELGTGTCARHVIQRILTFRVYVKLALCDEASGGCARPWREVALARSKIASERHAADKEAEKLGAQLDAAKCTARSLETARKAVERETAALQKEKERAELETVRLEAGPAINRSWGRKTLIQGLADIARHVVGCHLSLKVRVQMRWMTWRAVCGRPWVSEQRKAMDAKKEAWEEARKHKDDEARFKASQAEKKRAESAAKAADAAKRKADAAAAPKVGTTMHCPPHHGHAFEPSVPEINGIL